jgi:uncharacterized protein YfaT (DUF1175 family)
MKQTTEEMAELISAELLAEYTPEEAARAVARSPYFGPREVSWCLEWSLNFSVERVESDGSVSRPGVLVRPPAQVRCAGCRRLVARENARQHDGALFGACCWEKLRGPLAVGWQCSTCEQLLPPESMAVAGQCRRCADVPAELRADN